jgi:ABC-2 type transport system permease protein
MKRVLSQCLKELLQFRRDRLTLALAFILPTVTLLIFGFAIRLEAKDIPLLVQDFDRTVLSREYSDRLFATKLFTIIRDRDGERKGKRNDIESRDIINIIKILDFGIALCLHRLKIARVKSIALDRDSIANSAKITLNFPPKLKLCPFFAIG